VPERLQACRHGSLPCRIGLLTLFLPLLVASRARSAGRPRPALRASSRDANRPPASRPRPIRTPIGLTARGAAR
jgi:hypothetical protein